MKISRPSKGIKDDNLFDFLCDDPKMLIWITSFIKISRLRY